MKNSIPAPIVPVQQSSLQTRLTALFDLDNPQRFSRRVWIIIAIVIAIVLSPSLFFPLSHDGALFFVSGQKILRGAVHYRDIIDIKPPLIYYLYAVAIALFGNSDASIRILDFIIQGATIFLMISVIRRASGSDLWAAIAALLYAFVYVGQSPAGTAHTESYAGILGLGIIAMQMFRRTSTGFLLIGILVGLLCLFKFTLGMVLAASMVAEIAVFNEELRSLLPHYARMLLGLALIAALFLLYLFTFDAFKDFLLMLQYTQGYATIQWKGTGTWLKDFSKSIPEYLADNYSIVLSLVTAAGMAMSIPFRQLDHRQQQQPRVLELLQLCTIFFLSLILSVAVEGKYAPYQFGRIYAFGVVLAAYAVIGAIRLTLHVQLKARYLWFVTIVIVPVLLLFSPLTRYLYHSGAAVVKVTRGSTGLDHYYDQSSIGYTRTEMKQIGDYIIAHRKPGDKLFVLSGYGALLYRFANDVPDFKIYHGAPIMASYAPQQWKDSTAAYLLHQRPRFIVLQFTDSMAGLTGSNYSSEQALRALQGIDSLLNTIYRQTMRTEDFDLYERREPESGR